MEAVNARFLKGPARDAVVYVGRNPEHYGFVRHLAVLANRWTHRQGIPGTIWVPSREEAVACYRRWLWDRIKAQDTEVLAALRSLQEGDRVGCWCLPEACHAEVIVAAARWLRSPSV